MVAERGKEGVISGALAGAGGQLLQRAHQKR
jgi:hypothetical protein